MTGRPSPEGAFQQVQKNDAKTEELINGDRAIKDETVLDITSLLHVNLSPASSPGSA
jgi:hypothetical protein